MKKLLTLSILALLLLTACSSPKSIIREALDLTEQQSREIEKFFADLDIPVLSVTPSQDDLMQTGLGSDFAAYDVTAETGEEYILIIMKEDKNFCCILDRDYKVLEGIVDNIMLPSLFPLPDPAADG